MNVEVVFNIFVSCPVAHGRVDDARGRARADDVEDRGLVEVRQRDEVRHGQRLLTVAGLDRRVQRRGTREVALPEGVAPLEAHADGDDTAGV